MTTPESILAVDDEPAVCWALERLFSIHGYFAWTVQRGEEALALLAQRHFSHILLDAKLQDMDGLALAAQAREHNPDAIVLLISAYYYRDDPDITSALESGLINGFIPKPFTHAEILRHLQEDRAL
ncbi:MAG: response regulator [Thiohalocapsa sp.]|uniref:response regulator n=1 Tax=Thiohalocapsa sp. TaxID=2497641 RepID=UPI0025EAEFF2|nr:response regulator [Thiohalocapsa sp.]MCG6941190.1 response regulator [Thiohalocapsa sp.]